jgi:hypothetical protein
MILAATLTGAAIGTVLMLSAGGPAVASPGVAVPATYVDTLPACENEDGPGPCKWYAEQAGNGVGHSFWIGPDACMHYFDARDDRRWGDHSSPCVDPYAGDR